MCAIRAKEASQTDILRLEAEINALWGELNTANIPHAFRMEMEKKLAKCEEEFKAVLNGQRSFQNLEKELNAFNYELAEKALEQAGHELPKGDLGERLRLAIHGLQNQLKEGKISPTRARHEIKNVMRQKV